MVWMATTNKFLEFNEQKNDIQTDEEFLNDAQRKGGIQAGMARSIFHNKLFRQFSVMCSAIGQVVADIGADADDSSKASLVQAIKDTFLKSRNIKLNTITSYAYGLSSPNDTVDNALFLALPVAEGHKLSQSTAGLYALSGDNANVDLALAKNVNTSSYMAFCGNANAGSLDAAFGKNNESLIYGIGRQLAMYSWFKGDSKVDFPYTNLITKDKLSDCLADVYSFMEIINSPNLLALVNASPYAKALKDAQLSDTNISSKIRTLTGISSTYTTTASIINNNTALQTVCNNYDATFLLTHASVATWELVKDNLTKLEIIANRINAVKAIRESVNISPTHVPSIFLTSSLRVDRYFTSSSGQWKTLYEGKCIVVGGRNSDSNNSSSVTLRTLFHTSMGTTSGFSADNDDTAFFNVFSSLDGMIGAAERDTVIYYIPIS